MEKETIGKKISNLILRIVCWIGILLALLFVVFCIYLIIFEFSAFDKLGWTFKSILLLSYMVALFLFILLSSISVFRIYYLHHQPTIPRAKLRITLSIFTAITAAPTLFYLVKMAFVQSVEIVILDVAFTLLTSIAIYTLCGYIFYKTFLYLSQNENNHRPRSGKL